MQITDTLNGHTVEDVRRNPDGSVTLYCTSGRSLTLYVEKGKIVAKPPKIILPDVPEPKVPFSERMRLRESFQGYMIEYVTSDDAGCLDFICERLRGLEKYSKQAGRREIRLTHTNGLINELPPVSARIFLEGLSSKSVQGM